jgi:peptidoglycan/LPS O-acetylase OafA/YrhL
MMFPCLALALLGRVTAPRRIAFALALLAIATFVGPTIAVYFLIWLFGLAVFLMPPAKRDGLSPLVWWAALAVAAAVALAALAVSKMGGLGLMANDFAVALAVAPLIYTLTQAPARAGGPTAVRAAFGRLAHFLAGFSYTLYLIHLPILVFLAAWQVARGGARWQPDATHLAYGAGVAAFTLLCAAVFAQFSEARTGRIRAFLSARAAGAFPRR